MCLRTPGKVSKKTFDSWAEKLQEGDASVHVTDLLYSPTSPPAYSTRDVTCVIV